MRIAAFLAIVALFVVGVTTTRIPQPATAAPCDPNYTGCVPISSGDVNCDQVKEQVEVIGKDIYRLDADKDGFACESYAKSSNSSRSSTAPVSKTPGASANGQSSDGGCSTVFVAGKGVIDSCSNGHKETSRVYPRKPGVPRSLPQETWSSFRRTSPGATSPRSGVKPISRPTIQFARVCLVISEVGRVPIRQPSRRTVTR